MAKNSHSYLCAECGALSKIWKGQCSSCMAWNSLVEDVKKTSAKFSQNIKPICLSSLSLEDAKPYKTTIQELDILLGGGITPGSVILLAGDPGVGKSTLLLKLVSLLGTADKPTLYVSGEESLGQLQGRAKRLNILNAPFLTLASTNIEDVISAINVSKPKFVVIDSIQTMQSGAMSGGAGSVTQLRMAASELIEIAKTTNTAFIMVGHVTKDGNIAGPKLLEHMVDTVLYLEGDAERSCRILRVIKNRFGPTNELLLFTMDSSGMQIVNNPSTFFLDIDAPSCSGVATAVVIDGQKPFAVAVQSLVSKTFLAFPRRVSLGFDNSRLNLLVAILEKYLKLNFKEVDIYAKISGGLRLSDPALDVPIALAILSSFLDKPLPKQMIFWGEIDLSGSVRPVFGQEMRQKQAKQLKYLLYSSAKKQIHIKDLYLDLFKS